MSQQDTNTKVECNFIRFGLIVTGKSESQHLPSYEHEWRLWQIKFVKTLVFQKYNGTQMTLIDLMNADKIMKTMEICVICVLFFNASFCHTLQRIRRLYS